ncbi:hypothetical protein ACCY16_04795 [Candidatus Pantoea formicae]|uniref:hypothetical protein n=1 Tax=Candidatus Pantoea formicae TaxID=2608355 RepID=UPI003EDA81C7
MISNYFRDQHGQSRSEEKKREIAVSAVLEVIKAAAPNSSIHHSIDALKNEVSDAADAIQSALEKGVSK